MKSTVASFLRTEGTALYRESSYRLLAEASFQHHLRTRWLPAAIYLLVGVVLIALIRAIGI